MQDGVPLSQAFPSLPTGRRVRGRKGLPEVRRGCRRRAVRHHLRRRRVRQVRGVQGRRRPLQEGRIYFQFWCVKSYWRDQNGSLLGTRALYMFCTSTHILGFLTLANIHGRAPKAV